MSQIHTQVGRIAAIKTEQAPEARICEYSRQLSCLFEQGENALKDYSQKSTDLIFISIADYMVIL